MCLRAHVRAHVYECACRWQAMPVVDSLGVLLGMVKFRDVVKAAQAGKGEQAVKAWMRRDVVTMQADTPFDQLESALVAPSAPGRLPVVDAQGTLLGLVTRTDVLRQHQYYGGMSRRVA